MASCALRRYVPSVLAAGSVSKCPKTHNMHWFIPPHAVLQHKWFECKLNLSGGSLGGFCRQNAWLAFYSKALRVIKEDCKTCLALKAQFNLRLKNVEKPVFHDDWSGVSCRSPACRSDLTWRRILTGSKATTFQLWRSTCHGWFGTERVVYANNKKWLVNSSENITKSNMFSCGSGSAITL